MDIVILLFIIVGTIVMVFASTCFIGIVASWMDSTMDDDGIFVVAWAVSCVLNIALILHIIKSSGLLPGLLS